MEQAQRKIELPQEGSTRAAGGESLPERERSPVLRTRSGCPSFSGGGTQVLGGRADSPTASTTLASKTVSDFARGKELVVMLDRCDDSDSGRSLMTVDSGSTDRKRTFLSACSSDSEGEVPTKTLALPQRGRGRPPTHGKHVGLWEAKKKLIAEKKEAEELQARRELLETSRNARPRLTSRLSATTSEDEGSTAFARSERVKRNVGLVKDLFTKSKNVKGQIIHEAKIYLDKIIADVEEMKLSSVDDELRKLHSENNRLRRELQEMREDYSALRAEIREYNRQGLLLPSSGVPALPASDETQPHGLAEIRSVLNEVVGSMKKMQQRYEALETKLLRPPLQHERMSYAAKSAAQKPRPKPAGGAADDVPSMDRTAAGLSSHPAPKPSKGKGKGKQTRPATTPSETPEAPYPPSTSTQPADHNDGWAVAGRDGKHKPKRPPKTKKKAAPRDVAKTEKPRNKRRRRARKPKTAVVSFRLLPGAKERGISLAGILAAARQEVMATIKNEELGAVYMTGTLTDARLIHVPGPYEEAQKKADVLCSKLKDVLPAADVKVTRPMKTTTLRVSGLDDSVTKEDVLDALQSIAGFQGGWARCAEYTRVSEVRFGTFGLGVCWVTCPVNIAEILIKYGLRVGWTSAQIRVAEPRVLRCFRCMEPGHVGARCKAKVDRSGLCQRCAQPGHKALGCKAQPKCAVCADAGRPAGHRVGGPSCAAAKRPLRGGRGRPSVPNADLAATEKQQGNISAVPREEDPLPAPPVLLQGFSCGVSGDLSEGTVT